MYHNGQIVHDLEANVPVKVGSGGSTFAWENIPNKSTHYTCGKDPSAVKIHAWGVVLPKSVEEAKELLAKGLIIPARSLD